MLRKGLVAGLLAALTWGDAASCAAATKPCILDAGTHPELACRVSANGLPNVLYIGDSVSSNTMPQLRQELQSTANICHVYANAGTSEHGAACLQQWLTETGRGAAWQYVLFNFGIHDVELNLRGTPMTTLDDYRRNLRTIVNAIRHYGATPLWVTTTPFPATLVGTKFTDPAPYALISSTEMRLLNVPVIDTYDLILPVNNNTHDPRDGVHWTPRATEILSNAITGALTGQILFAQR